MSDQAEPNNGTPAQIDGPAVFLPVAAQVQAENLNVLAARHVAPPSPPDAPVTIADDMKEDQEVGNDNADAR